MTDQTDNIINKLKIASLQASALITLRQKQSGLVKFAYKLSKYRKSVKNKVRLYFKKLFRKKPQRNPNILYILVHVRGGIGDAAMARIFLKKLRLTLHEAHITFSYDSFKVAHMLLNDGTDYIDDFIDKDKYFIDDYDIVLSGCHVLVYKKANKMRVKNLAPHFIPILEKGLVMTEIFKVIDDNTPYLDGYLANITVPLGYSRVANLGLSTGLDILHDETAPLLLKDDDKKDILKKFDLDDKLYITMHNGVSDFTNTQQGYLTRSWPMKNWQALANLIKQAFPNITIVQIGSIKSHKFDFAHKCLVGKTELADLPYIIDGALLHIDGESGMVQLANLLSTVSVVIFGPTPIKYFAYSKNINIPSPKCDNCMCIEKRWMTKCLMGYNENDGCMAAVTAQMVFEKVNSVLKNKI